MKTPKGLQSYLKKDTLVTTGSQVAGTIIGLGTAAVINRQVNPEKAVWVPLGMFAAGIMGVHFLNVNEPKDWLGKICKSAAGSVGIYGGLKLAEMALAPATPGDPTIKGFIPESIKDKLRQFLPTISGLGDIPGYANDPLSNLMGVNNYYSPAPPSYPIDAATFGGAAEGEFQMAEVL